MNIHGLKQKSKCLTRNIKYFKSKNKISSGLELAKKRCQEKIKLLKKQKKKGKRLFRELRR